MANSKSRLGRGLGALIASGTPAFKPAGVPASVVPASAPAGLASGYQDIPLHLIEPNPYQPRREMNPEQMAELIESIRAEGLLQPVVVRPVGGKYQLIAGERRWRAFQQLKLKSIPARVMASNDASSATLALIENLQREGLNPIDEAHGYASLIRDFDLTQDAAAQRVGRNRATVANSLRLLSLEPEIQGYLGKGLLSVGHAKVLLGVENSAERLLFARRCLEEGLSVRGLEDLLKRRHGPSRVRHRQIQAAEATALADLEKRLTSHLSARVTLRHSPKRGRIIIEYQGNADLQRLLEKIGMQG
ncbi:MAG: ParB/RepB/Spo0J family partition protein [Opitutaceae bacterium]|nr:ParB/RepB/Spo0J family partition protein [Opitutaceae bacterium]